jgi:CheY-like chemotaxis protein
LSIIFKLYIFSLFLLGHAAEGIIGPHICLSLAADITSASRARLCYSTVSKFQIDQTPLAASPMPPKQILIVEDEAVIAHSLQYVLERLGYAVCAVVDNGSAAVEKVAQLEPDLVIMDIHLHGVMDGIDAAHAISQMPYSPPVIFLTAYADEGTIARAKITQPFGYILKPFEERELSVCIEIALYKASLELQLKESEQIFSTTLKSIGEAVLVIDTGARIKFTNFLAANLLGVDEDTAFGRTLTELVQFITPKGDRADIAFLQQVMRSGLVQQLEEGYRLETAGGQHANLAGGTISPIINDKGVTTGAVMVLPTGSRATNPSHNG